MPAVPVVAADEPSVACRQWNSDPFVFITSIIPWMLPAPIVSLNMTPAFAGALVEGVWLWETTLVVIRPSPVIGRDRNWSWSARFQMSDPPPATMYVPAVYELEPSLPWRVRRCPGWR